MSPEEALKIIKTLSPDLQTKVCNMLDSARRSAVDSEEEAFTAVSDLGWQAVIKRYGTNR
jgi:hypothetical protein